MGRAVFCVFCGVRRAWSRAKGVAGATDLPPGAPSRIRVLYYVTSRQNDNRKSAVYFMWLNGPAKGRWLFEEGKAVEYIYIYYGIYVQQLPKDLTYFRVSQKPFCLFKVISEIILVEIISL